MKKRLIPMLLLVIVSTLGLLSSCKNNDPNPENIPELITKAKLKFTPTGGTAIEVTATDPDGEGVQNIKIDGPINLVKGTTYTLSLELYNELYKSSEEGYDISKAVAQEANEHQFFFEWTDGIFSNPTGNGNIDNKSDPVNYGSSVDSKGLPLGLTTSWTTSAAASDGAKIFRILLKHQPEIKSTTSTSADGETDLDLTFTIAVQ
jgi:hypothetical protein